MALRKLKPTSPGQRFVVRVVQDGLHKGEPHESLLRPLPKRRRPQQPGPHHDAPSRRRSQARYRVIDFKRDKDGVAGRVERLEYDPNRTSHLALVLYADGERRYIIAPKRREGRRRDHVGRRRADQAGQYAAAAEHSARHAQCTASS